MADSKITALAALTAADPANDMVPIVDVSDNSMAASGTTKRISINNILACSPSATLASATISGDLTVDTSTLKVDSANNRVGIGTASPAAPVDVQGSSLRLQLQSSSNGGYATWKYIGKNSSGTAVNFEQGLNIAADNAFELYDNQNTQLVSRYVSGVSGAHSWFLTGSTAMTLNSTGLGVGVVPSAGKGALQLSSGINFPATQVASSDANTLDDYEEGTWTGTLKGSVSDPTTPVTATGKYTKIGRQVFVEITFNGVNTTGASGNITVTGLTFPCGSNINGVGVVSLNQIGTFTGSPYVFLSQSTSVLELYGNVSAGAGAAITHNAGSLRYMTISLTYTV
jgi:hypothetical protein